MTSRQAVARNSTKIELQVFQHNYESALSTNCSRVSILGLASITPAHSEWMQSQRKIFDSGRIWPDDASARLLHSPGRRSNQNSTVTVTSKLQSLSSFSKLSSTL